MSKQPLLPGRLLAISAFVQPNEITLAAGRCELGRSPTRDVVASIPTVSRLHAVIERREDRYWLCDAGSANGTFVNGQQIGEPHLLADGETIGLGGPEPLLRFAQEEPTVLHGAPAPPDSERLQFHPTQLAFSVRGQIVPLPPTQLRLLHHLYSHAGEVCTRESCAQAVWGHPYDATLDRDALDKVVSKLRRRLAAVAPELADLLQSRRNEGYVFLCSTSR
jgi:DNA-binding response OmpR family regulator